MTWRTTRPWVNGDPYGEGWLLKVELDDDEPELLSADEYAKVVRNFELPSLREPRKMRRMAYIGASARSPREDFEAAGKRLPWDAAARSAALSATAPVSDVKASANGADNASNAEHSDDMPTVPIPARKAATTFDTPSKRERIEVKPPITRFIRRAVTRVFGVWSRISTQVVRQWDWYPRVEPYVGLWHRRLLASDLPHGIRPQARAIRRTDPRHPRHACHTCAPRTHVQASIDDMPLNTVQIGVSEVYDKVDRTRDLGSEYAISDSAGYLDLVAEHRLVPGIHRVSLQRGQPQTRERQPVHHPRQCQSRHHLRCGRHHHDHAGPE